MWWLLTSLEAGNWIRWVWDLPWPSEGFPDPCLGTSKMGYWSLMVSHWSFWYWSFRGILILIKMDGMRIAINDSSMTQRPSLVCNSYSSMISEDRPVFLRQLGGFRFFRRSMCRMTMPMDSAQEPTRVNMTCWFISPMFVAWSPWYAHCFQKPQRLYPKIASDHIGPATSIHIYSFKLLKPHLILLNRLIDYPL
jgi:hypothetical protein